MHRSGRSEIIGISLPYRRQKTRYGLRNIYQPAPRNALGNPGGPKVFKKLSSNCRMRVATAFAAGLVVAVSASSWASFQYVGKPLGTQSDPIAGSTVYISGPIGKTPFETRFPGLQAIQNPTDPLLQKGAGIAWPCHGAGSGTISQVLYHLLPAGWKIYAQPGVVLGLPVQYSCHDDPWTVPMGKVLHEQGLVGTLWWGYDVLSLAPQDSVPQALPQGIQPGGPMIPAQPDPVVKANDPKPAPKAIQSTDPLTVGANGQIIKAGWKQHVIPLTTSMREGWKLALPVHPSPAQIHLAEAWMRNGGVLYRPLPKS